MWPGPRRDLTERVVSVTPRRGLLLGALGLGAFSAIFWLHAWVNEDAYITFRSVEQLFAGNGPRWNPHERVQVFTHPLWYFVLASLRLVHSDHFINAIVAGYLLCLVTLWAQRRLLGTWPRWLAFVLLLIGSKSFVDYTSSGLENSLSFALLSLFLLVYFESEGEGAAARSGSTALSLLVGLMLLTRHDLGTLVAAPLLWHVWQARGGSVASWLAPYLLGFLPFGVWTLFSLFYYGFPFPNTAYAKLGAGIPAADLWGAGVGYLRSHVTTDLLVLVVPAAAVVVCLRAPGGATKAVGVGVLLNLVYVVAIGGDYMAGRFLTAAYLVAAAVLVRTAHGSRAAVPLLACVALYAALSPLSPIHTRFDSPHRPVDAWGVGDTRNNFFRVASIRSWLRRAPDAPFPDHAWSRAGAKFGATGTRVSEWPAIGIYAYSAGTDKVVIDRFALADPLLARLPSSGRWRVGHFRRAVPSGYLKSVRRRQNFIVDPEIREFYDHLRLITEGELVSRERFATIVRMNLGFYDHLLPQRGDPAIETD